MTYSERLKDPRWQKKRLKILDRDKWTCQKCGDKETTLHVHHLKYNKNPWDGNYKDLVTLCKDCHTAVEHFKKECEYKKIKIFKRSLDYDGYLIFISSNGTLKMGLVKNNESIFSCTFPKLNSIKELSELLNYTMKNQ